MSRHRGQVLAPLTAAALILAVPSPAPAMTGFELQRFCTDAASNTICVGYLRGFVDGIAIGSAMASPADRLYCQPSPGLVVEQARIVVEKFLRDHPEGLDREAGLLVGAALIAVFRCH